MNKIGTKLVKVQLTEEEFAEGRRLLYNTNKCIGAKALAKAFPNTQKVDFGAVSGQVCTDKYMYTYASFDENDVRLVVVSMTKSSPIVFKLVNKQLRIKTW